MKYKIKDILEGIENSEKLAISRAMSIIENTPEEGVKILKGIYTLTGDAFRVGLTGPPGVGKSTITNALTEELLKINKSVGIIAIDPSSRITGGALLGDRVRMNKISLNENVFVRSFASRGIMGGLNRTAFEAADVLDASGKDYIFIETVGVGQTEIDVVDITDITIVIFSPESGDSIQAMKSGLMENGDIMVINKMDRPGSNKLAYELKNSIELSNRAIKPEILLVSAETGQGIPELISNIQNLKDKMFQNNYLAEKRKKNLRNKLNALLETKILNLIAKSPKIVGEIEKIIDDVQNLTTDPYTGIQNIITKNIFLNDSEDVK